MRKDEFALVDKIREEAYQQGRADAIEEIKGTIFGTFANDTMKILTLKRWIKEQKNENS